MLNLSILPRVAALMTDGADRGLADVLTSGTAIVVYIFIILTVIAILVVTVLLGGRDKGEKSDLTDVPVGENGVSTTEGNDIPSRFCMLSRIDRNLHGYGHARYDRSMTLERFCEDFRNYAAYQLKLYYDIDDIRRFVAGMAVSRILILQGMSGTGKTSLAHAFGEFVDNRSTVIPVQPMWKERTDLIGYYNEFTKRFNETLLLEK
ncbi:MAG: hypothetical protein IJX72_03860, partial [Clostridia bacterium]|nr:hypothetical protein [Clostridia bacterium]